MMDNSWRNWDHMGYDVGVFGVILYLVLLVDLILLGIWLWQHIKR